MMVHSNIGPYSCYHSLLCISMALWYRLLFVYTNQLSKLDISTRLCTFELYSTSKIEENVIVGEFCYRRNCIIKYFCKVNKYGGQGSCFKSKRFSLIYDTISWRQTPFSWRRRRIGQNWHFECNGMFSYWSLRSGRGICQAICYWASSQCVATV